MFECLNPCSSQAIKNPKYDLGCFGHCEEVCLDLQAPEEGDYTFQFRIVGGKLRSKRFYSEGDQFCFNTESLNESNETTLEIYDSSGALIEFEDGACTYSGFTFQIEIIKHI